MENEISEANRCCLFEMIKEEILQRVDSDFYLSLKKGSATQASSKISEDFVKNILIDLGIFDKQASSQKSKDFRNIGGLGLDIEVKNASTNSIIMNDCCPSPNIFYVIFVYTREKTVCVNGSELRSDSDWIDEFQQLLDCGRDKYCRGPNKPKTMISCYLRPTWCVNIKNLLKE